MNWHAALWQSNGSMQDLGALTAGDNSEAYGINDDGQVVGYSGPQGGAEQAFLWQSGTGMQALGTLPEEHGAPPPASTTTGRWSGQPTPAATPTHAFLWQTGDGMLDLNSLIAPSSGWTLNAATAINDKGQIFG